MQTIDLELSFKGARHYLHGTDFYRVITSVIGETHGGYLGALAFRAMATTACQLVFDQDVANASHPCGQGSWCCADGTSLRFWICPTDTSVAGRYDYDEDLISRDAVITDTQIQTTRNNTYSAIENAVALTKTLNQQLSPDAPGKWLFGQLAMKGPFPADWTEMTIHRTACMADRFSRNAIIVDGNDLGEIRFIVEAS